jgi:hypothetical protein
MSAPSTRKKRRPLRCYLCGSFDRVRRLSLMAQSGAHYVRVGHVNLCARCRRLGRMRLDPTRFEKGTR